jgi:hypothetical protein
LSETPVLAFVVAEFLGCGRRLNIAQTDQFWIGVNSFSTGVFFGVSLLSRRRLSGLPVDFAIGLGPGLIVILKLL